MSTIQFFPDSVTRGAHFFNATARVQDDRLRFTGVFDAAELVPVLLFSVGVPWVEPCVKNMCCLWEVVNRYKDNDLLSALGDSCDENMNFTGKRLMKGSTVVTTTSQQGGTLQQWDLTTRIHPNFIVMLFLCLTPAFYMYYEVVPVQWIERHSVTWSSAWYGDRCHTVTYPDGREVCIHCSNPKPQHSAYVFSSDWFQTFECKWICDAGYTGPNCEVAVDTAIYAAGGMFVVMCISGIMLVAMYGRNLNTVRGVSPKKAVALHDEENMEHVVPDKKQDLGAPILSLLPPTTTPRAMARSEMITFKDNHVIGEIRIKLL
jgi:hypothetical protein